MKKPKAIGPSMLPWEPPQLSKSDYYAIKALYAGNASEGQQKRLWALLMLISAVEDLEFRPGPDGDRASAFAGGKRFVGQQFIKAVKLPPSVVDQFD